MTEPNKPRTNEPTRDGINLNPVECQVYDELDVLKTTHPDGIPDDEMLDHMVMNLPDLTVGQIKHSLMVMANVGVIKWTPYEEE